MNTDTPQRYGGPDPDALTDAQRRVCEVITSGPRGQVVGPLKVWLCSPRMADRAQALGQYARYDSSLPRHLSELAILVTARIWSSGFEWSHHVPTALSAGVSWGVINGIGQGQRPELAEPEMRAVFDFAVELHRDRAVSDSVYQQAEQALSTQGVVDLVAICGYYSLISMTINAFDVPDGDGPALPVLDLAPERMFR